MKTIKITCNLCGNEIKGTEYIEVRQTIPYGSRHDGQALELDICPHCLDILVDSCMIFPIKESGGLSQ